MYAISHTDICLYCFVAYREFFVCLHTFRKEKEIIMAIFIELFLLGVGLSMDAFAVSSL